MNQTGPLKSSSNVLEMNIEDVVSSASKVIVPLGPIQSFAARSPWAHLEGQTFEQVARLLKDTCDVDIYPNESILRSARKKGKMNQIFLEKGLQNWLSSQSLKLPTEIAVRFCRAALSMDHPSPNLQQIPGLHSLARKLRSFQILPSQKHSVQTYSQRLEHLGGEKLTGELNRHIIKWCKLFLDESQAAWSMPNREEGFYRAWRQLVRHDPALSLENRRQLSDLPENADQALNRALSALDIPNFQIQGYLEAHLLALPGWAGMMLWRSQQSLRERSLLTDYLAVRLIMEWVLIRPFLPIPKQSARETVSPEPLIAAWAHWGGLPISEWSKLTFEEQKARLSLANRFDKIVRSRLLLEAWEKTYEEQFAQTILSKLQPAAVYAKPALAQFIFCIDVRSEPFRRKLEDAGPFETFGTAGFFGLPIETYELGSRQSQRSLPVMFDPQFKIKEASAETEFRQYQQRMHSANSLGRTFNTMKHNLLSSLLLPEISGPWLSIQTLTRSFIPRRIGQLFHNLRKTWIKKPSTKLSLDYEPSPEQELPVGFSEKEKVYYVRQALKMMGLTDHFASLVVICGHGSHSTNNPYASALDCGACGGASSGFNARVLAQLCNLSDVRRTLASEGISIPKDTVFVAAEHITTLDQLRWLYVPELSAAAREAYKHVQSILPEVSNASNAERMRHLPGIGFGHKNPKTLAEHLSEDWSEVRPEWGLAGNTAFVIGERRLTRECNLDGRVFLHNYNWRKDKSGALLARIMTGPVTVAQWINLQYYASTVAPHYYGSGNKTTQTVTSGVGVMQGTASDLLAGLPWQSVMLSDHEVYHPPLRLLVVIQAPKKYVERLLHDDHTFRQKWQNQWIRLASIDPEGHWESWS